MKIKKQTISDNISEYLRDQIMTRKLKEGDRIVECQIAKELGVSQAPVREALLQLEGMGLVKNKPYVGAYVLPIDMDVIQQAYELRNMLETYAVSLVIDKINEEEVARMEKHLQNMRDALARDDRRTIIDEDNQFHSVVVKHIGNPMLLKMWQMSSTQWASLTITYYDDMDYIVESHVKIIECLRTKDLESLKKELQIHFKNAAAITLHAFEKICEKCNVEQK